jgi:hypothetical protein
MAKAKTPETVAALTFECCKVGYLYGLYDPFTKELRYIGKTVDVARRFREHKNSTAKEKTRKSNWIKSLKKRKALPIGKVLFCFPLETLSKNESYYIQEYRKIHSLLNDCDGSEAEKFYTYKAKNEKELKERGCIGIKQKRDLWEVYLNLDNQRYYCGAFKNKVIAQKVYDAVARNYLPDYRLVTNFIGVSKLTVEQAQQFSKKLSKKRNNYTSHEGVYYYKDKNKYLVTIKKGNERVKLGYTPNLQEALKVRDGVAKYYKKEDFELVYPEAEPLTIKQAQDKLNTKTVKYRGISFRKTDGRYCATITLNSKNYTLPLFTKVEEAVKWYDRVAGYYNKPTNFKPDFTLPIEEARIKIKQERKNKPNL